MSKHDRRHVSGNGDPLPRALSLLGQPVSGTRDSGIWKVLPPSHILYLFTASAFRRLLIESRSIDNDINITRGVYARAVNGDILRVQVRSVAEALKIMDSSDFVHIHESIAANLNYISEVHRRRDEPAVGVKCARLVEPDILHASRRMFSKLLKRFAPPDSASD